jgi:hypothetical protein
MKANRKRIKRTLLVLVAIAFGLVCIATFGKRPPRALVAQPGDFFAAVVAEFRHADTTVHGCRMVKHVTGMFWNCFEIRMVDGRTFSGLPYWEPTTGEISTKTQAVVTIDVTSN